MSVYKVMFLSTPSSRSRGEAVSYVVTNAPSNWDHEDKKWPRVAEFPVDIGYTDADQCRRAEEYRDYMNAHVVVVPPIGTV